MHILILLVFSVSLTPICARESRIPMLFEYSSSDRVSSDTVILDSFVVEDRRLHSLSLPRELVERRGGDDVSLSSGRIFLDTEWRSDLPREFYLTERQIFSRPDNRLALKLDDTFLIDLFGETMVRANFRSGLSFQVRKGVRIILKPSRRRLVSVRFDW